MKGKRNCTLCGGEGTYDEPRDAHRSGGRVPCYYDPDLKKKPFTLKPNVFKEPCNCDASCGENRSHELGSPGCRYRNKDEFFEMVKPTPKPKPKTETNGIIQIPPDVDTKKPEEWKMALNVADAMKFNEDFIKIKEERDRMKAALNRIITETEDADTIRFALIGLDFKSD